MTFHEQLEDLRKRSGLSYEQVAIRAGTHSSYVWHLCQGKRKPSRDFIWRLSLALALDLEQTDELLVLAGHLTLVGDPASSRAAQGYPAGSAA